MFVEIGAIEREKEIAVNLFIYTIFPYEIFKVKLLPLTTEETTKRQGCYYHYYMG